MTSYALIQFMDGGLFGSLEHELKFIDSLGKKMCYVLELFIWEFPTFPDGWICFLSRVADNIGSEGLQLSGWESEVLNRAIGT